METTTQSFLRVLDPNDNATGGGTASAVAGAMAASLAAMVARLSAGKEGMQPADVYAAVDAEGQALSTSLMQGGQEDAEAFDRVRAAYKLPKLTPEDKAARSAAIQEALVHSTRVPLANAERCVAVLDLASRLEPKYNLNAESDLKCAVHLARAGLLGCLANVTINAGSIKDESVRSELLERARLPEARAQT